MENKYFSLGSTENNLFVKVIRIIFGLLCILVAGYWFAFNIKSLKADWTLWITVLFLLGFGFYQVWSGLGKANRFIEFGKDYILLRKNPMLPAVRLEVSNIEKIELFPLNVVFFLKSKKRILLRFGTTYQDTNELIKDELFSFTGSNNIPLEVVEEKI